MMSDDFEECVHYNDIHLIDEFS